MKMHQLKYPIKEGDKLVFNKYVDAIGNFKDTIFVYYSQLNRVSEVGVAMSSS